MYFFHTESADSGYSDISPSYDIATDAIPSGMSSINLNRSNIEVIRDQVVHKIQKSFSEKDKCEEEPSRRSLPDISSCSSSSFSTSPTSKSLPSEEEDITEKDILDLLKEMPPHMRFDYHDAFVIYCDDDRSRVEEFMENFDEIKLYDRVKPKVVLYDNIAISIGSKIKALEFGIDRCTYVFLFITKAFCDDSWSEFSSETCLMEAIHNPDKKWCVVPVFTEPKRSASFRVPPSLNSLKGIQYLKNDKFFKDSVAKLLEEKLYIREEKVKKLTGERKEWVSQYRIEMMKEETGAKKELLDRRNRELHNKMQQQQELEELKRLGAEAELRHEQDIRHIKGRLRP